jgi:SAM-dependent methyltransferase
VGADAHFLPFPSKSFDLIVMIGSVINYCDASRLISECARCMRDNAVLIFDFENLRTWEYWRHWQSNVALASTDYAGTSEKIWVYSPALMQTILATHQLTIERRVHLHTLTGLFLGVWDCEVLRRALAPLDRIWAAIPLVRNRAATIVLTCRKGA